MIYDILFTKQLNINVHVYEFCQGLLACILIMHMPGHKMRKLLQIYNEFFFSCIDQPKSRSKIDIQVFKIFKHKGTKSQKWYMFTFVESAYN